MLKRILNAGTLLTTGLILTIMGIITIILNTKLLQIISLLLSLTIFALAIFSLIRYFLSKIKSDRKVKISLVIVNLSYAFLILLWPRIPYYFVPFLFSSYLMLMAVIQFVNYYLLKKNQVPNRIYELISSLICLGISILFLFSPMFYAEFTIGIIGIYLLLLGFNYLTEYIFTVIPNIKKRNKTIRVTLPKFMLALIPYQTLVRTNSYLLHNTNGILEKKKDNRSVALEIFIHVSTLGFGKIGHADFCFDGLVYSYGNYDFNSPKFFELFGDGVLFKTKEKEKYLEFCIKHSEKTIYGFDIYLTDEQKEKIKNKISVLNEDTVKWKVPKRGNAYAPCLNRAVKTDFYKFSKGKYKTYFTIGTNCVKMVDDIVGMDILSVQGIISPGTYYNYLEKEFLKKQSAVIGYHIYNEKWLREKKSNRKN